MLLTLEVPEKLRECFQLMDYYQMLPVRPEEVHHRA